MVPFIRYFSGQLVNSPLFSPSKTLLSFSNLDRTVLAFLHLLRSAEHTVFLFQSRGKPTDPFLLIRTRVSFSRRELRSCNNYYFLCWEAICLPGHSYCIPWSFLSFDHSRRFIFIADGKMATHFEFSYSSSGNYLLLGPKIFLYNKMNAFGIFRKHHICMKWKNKIKFLSTFFRFACIHEVI